MNCFFKSEIDSALRLSVNLFYIRPLQYFKHVVHCVEKFISKVSHAHCIHHTPLKPHTIRLGLSTSSPVSTPSTPSSAHTRARSVQQLNRISF